MYCINCGKEVKENSNFCDSCGTNVNIAKENLVDTTIQDEKNANLLCIISLILYFGSGIVFGLLFSLFPNGSKLESLSGLSPLAGIVLMIVARIKYPKNKFAKVLMWIYISLTILGLIAMAIFLVACAYALKDCNTLG